MKKRLIALTLSLGLVLGLFTGCGQESEDGIPTAAKKDVVSYLTDGAIHMKDTVATVNGEDVAAPYYFYWLAYYTSVLSSSGITAEDLTTEQDGTTPVEAVKSAAQYATSYYYTLSQRAKEEGYSLTEEEAQMEDPMDETSLLYYCTNAAEQNTMYSQYQLANKVLDPYYLAYAEENNYYTCRYLLFSTMDENGETIEDPDSQKAACAQAYEELKAVEPDKLEETFQEYQEKYNVTDKNTDRFTFQQDSVVSGFADLTAQLEEQELGMTEEPTEYGYFVVLRLPLELDDTTRASIHSDFSDSSYVDNVTAWMDETEATFSDAVEQLDLTAFCTNLMELQTTIDGAEAQNADTSANS